ncbi:MAG TPA: Mur ligase family protein, partial [Vicinamibacterales bacterium]
MTWAQLHGILRASGAIRMDAPPPWDPALTGLAEANRTITSVAYDSRTVEPGAVFVALKGLHADGAAFVRQALERGAIAIVSEQPPSPGSGFGEPGPPPADVRVPWAVVQDARLALAQIAATFFRHPSAEMQVVGITGTNGKTTTAYLLSSIFEAAGIRCGVLGTVAYRIGDEVREATRTTPEAPDVQRLLREMVDRGCGACAMEVSSH